MPTESLIEQFRASLPYPLDDFQLEAIQALANSHSVLVAAPTGTGKTVIGEFGIFMARKYNTRAGDAFPTVTIGSSLGSARLARGEPPFSCRATRAHHKQQILKHANAY